MSLDRLLVLIFGAGTIAFVYWFFLMKKEQVVTASDSVDITVEGGYKPAVVAVRRNQATVINFLRTDPNGCLEEVIVPEFKIRRFLPLNEKVSVTITPTETGEFVFFCGMNMYRGKIIVS